MVKAKKDEKEKGLVESGAEKPEEEMTHLTEDKDGNTFLPGNEIPVPVKIKPLIDKVREIEKTLKPAFASARDALITAKDKVSELAHKHIDHFSEPDEKGTRTYRAGGVIVSITFEKEKINTKLDDED